MISWRKDGEDVNEDVELRETLPNQDGSFQKRSILKVPAEDLQKHTYTCVIQHSSLKETQKKRSPSPEVVCHATGFFPKEVNITWRKDGEDVNEDVELRETLPNQDGSFQKRSILKVPAEDLQKHTYTCVIQHSSLKEELVLEVPKGGGLMPIIVGVLVALVVLVAGIMVWKKKNSGFKRAPASEGDSSSDNS
ncbi:hypothetical protein KOW79_018396 [Hemibagrus wyckioides]|uniref:Ig-like domain-containing protein n=1 Tax=Hemibagrus wyckioides TaxID=337641 RepID=A0A9D3N8G3_9TELE|nr:hypothetical protein KOW79_018396 [Hemibagrus wyckioides]